MEVTKMPDPLLLATVTGEAIQPVRLHYRVADPQGLLKAFKKLRCMEDTEYSLHDAIQAMLKYEGL
jgi:hypothetical protein